MRKALLTLVAVALMAASAPAEQLEYLDKLPPIIDREIFFGDPEISSAQISPDGKYISFLKTYRGKMNIWVKGVDEPFDEICHLRSGQGRRRELPSLRHRPQGQGRRSNGRSPRT
jgi:hypothetical protein